MRLPTLIAAAMLATTFLVATPADAIPECDALDPYPCPGIVCIGSGGWYGYAACVGYGYCDPAACDLESILERVLP